MSGKCSVSCKVLELGFEREKGNQKYILRKIREVVLQQHVNYDHHSNVAY